MVPSCSFTIPATRKNVITLNLGCVLIWCGVYIEKGIGLVVPGFTPSTLGEIYEYSPTMTEFQVAFGIFAVGALVFTFLSRVAIALTTGGFGLRTPLEPKDPPGDAVSG